MIFLCIFCTFSKSYAVENSVNENENTTSDYTNQLGDINKGQQELHNTITDDNVSNVNIDLPTDNTNDITEAEFNKILISLLMFLLI